MIEYTEEEIAQMKKDGKIVGKGFFISYYRYPRAGIEETALVSGMNQSFLILTGDWRKEYSEIIDEGYDACVSFFESKREFKDPRSYY